MHEFMSRVRPEDATLVLFLLLACITGITAWVTLQWRLHRRTEIEAALKQEMLQRGMSAEEIERVMQASAATASADEARRARKNPFSRTGPPGRL